MIITLVREFFSSISIRYILINNKKIFLSSKEYKLLNSHLKKLINYEVICNQISFKILYYYEIDDLPQQLKEKIIIKSI